MANSNFVVHNGLTVGPVTIDAATGVVTGGTLASDGFSGNVIGGLAQFAALNSTPIGNAVPSTGAFTTLAGTDITASGDIGAVNATFTGDVGAVGGTYSGVVQAPNFAGGMYTGNIATFTGNVQAAHVTGTGATFTENVVINGDLTIEGDVVSADTAELNVADRKITLNYSESGDTSATANGSGIEIQDAVNASTDATMLWNGTSDKFAFSHGIVVTGTIDGTTVTASTTTTTPSITKTGSNGSGDVGQTGNRFNVLYGKSTSAQYADLAEKYEADADLEPGTVVHFGGEKEVAQCDVEHCTKVAGVVSTNPAFKMNDTLEAQHTAMVALTGRVPCKVTGVVEKGDMMVSAGNGLARAEADPKVGAVIGKALEAHQGGEGVIEVVIGKH